MSGAELARRSFVTPQTMNAIVSKLETAGMIERQPHPEHGRVLRADLTEKGRELVSEAHEVVRGVEERMLSGLDSDERTLLTDMLSRCTDSLEN